MKEKFNATLVINNSNNLMYDIWQYKNDFDKQQWKSAICSFCETLQDIYDNFSEDIPNDRLYVLGDVINLLGNIDLEVEE